MKHLHFAGYDFSSGPDGTVIHRNHSPRPAHYEGNEYGSDPVLDADGEPTGWIRMVPTGRLVRVLPIGYGTFNVFQRYWWGQGDPLYAVLSRRGTSVDWVTVYASEAEWERLVGTAEEILEVSDDECERRVARAFLDRNELGV